MGIPESSADVLIARAARPRTALPLGSVEIAPYRPGDEREILECVRACFGFEPELATWRHLYLENPAGQPIIVLARSRDTVVSHLAIVPHRMRAFGGQAMVGHLIDQMTHPAWQRRGLQRALTAEAEQIARDEGLRATYVVSNEQSQHGDLKYGGRTSLGSFPVLVRPLRPLRAGSVLAQRWCARVLGAGRATVPGDTGIDCAAAGPMPDDGQLAAVAGAHSSAWMSPAFDVHHTELFRDAEGVPPIAVVRDATQLAWRYPAGPRSPYLQRDVTSGDRLVATVVVRAVALAGLRLVFVMEWHWRRGAADAARFLMDEAIGLARVAGAHGMAALATPHASSRRLLHRLGFLPVPEVLFPKTSRMSVRAAPDERKTSRWYDPANWYLTWGDGLVL